MASSACSGSAPIAVSIGSSVVRIGSAAGMATSSARSTGVSTAVSAGSSGVRTAAGVPAANSFGAVSGVAVGSSAAVPAASVARVAPSGDAAGVGAGPAAGIPCGSVASGDVEAGRPHGRCATAVPASSSTVNARDGTSTNASGHVPAPGSGTGGPTRTRLLSSAS
jgi:hypothetical protein